MVGEYQAIMEKHVNPCMKGLTEEGQLKLVETVKGLGEQGLKTTLEISKAIIENYFLNSNLSQPILDLIEKNVEIQRIAEKHLHENKEVKFK